MKVRVVTNENGNISVVYAADNARKEGETVEEQLERVCKSANIHTFPYVIMDSSEIPQTREDRDAWELVDGKVVVNKEKAKIIRESREKETLLKEEKDKIITQLAEKSLKEKGRL
jgi:lipopolysaccharide export LptBFGC system permease protein LptF